MAILTNRCRLMKERQSATSCLLRWDSHAQVSGELSRIHLPHVVDKKAVSGPTVISVRVGYSPDNNDSIASGQVGIAHKVGLTESESYISLDEIIAVDAGQTYYLTLQVNDGDSEIELCSPVRLQFQPGQGGESNEIGFQRECIGRSDFPVILSYTPQEDLDLEWSHPPIYRIQRALHCW